MLFTKSRGYHCPEQRSCCPVSSDMFDMTEFYHVMEVEVICATSGSCLKERGHIFPFLSFYPFCWPKRTREERRWIRHCGIRQRRCIMRMRESWETASQWTVSYPIDPMSLMQAAGRGGGINIYLLSFSYQRVWMLNQTCSYQIHRMQRHCQSKV